MKITDHAVTRYIERYMPDIYEQVVSKIEEVAVKGQIVRPTLKWLLCKKDYQSEYRRRGDKVVVVSGDRVLTVYKPRKKCFVLDK